MNVAMISYHTCPLAVLGGKDTGGMNVYVREVTRYLGRCGVHVDVYTRSQDEHVPHVLHDLGYGNRVVHIPAGPEVPLPKQELAAYLPEFAEGIRRFAAEKGIHYDLIHSHYWMSGIAAERIEGRMAGAGGAHVSHAGDDEKPHRAQPCRNGGRVPRQWGAARSADRRPDHRRNPGGTIAAPFPVQGG